VAKKVLDFRGRPVGDLILRGRSEPLRAFEPLRPDQFRGAPTQAYLDAFAKLESSDPDALGAFAAVVSSMQGDRLASFISSGCSTVQQVLGYRWIEEGRSICASPPTRLARRTCVTPSWDVVNYRCRRPGFLMRGVLLPSVILWGPEREPVQNVAQSSMPFLLVALLRSFPLFLLDLIQNCFWRYVALDLADF
jgi:hypothetical protein